MAVLAPLQLWDCFRFVPGDRGAADVLLSAAALNCSTYRQPTTAIMIGVGLNRGSAMSRKNQILIELTIANVIAEVCAERDVSHHVSPFAGRQDTSALARPVRWSQ